MRRFFVGVRRTDLSSADSDRWRNSGSPDPFIPESCPRSDEGVEVVSAYVTGRGLSRAERRREVAEERGEERGDERGDEAPARDAVPLEALMVAIGAGKDSERENESIRAGRSENPSH